MTLITQKPKAKYIEFLRTCKFADIYQLKYGAGIKGKLPEGLMDQLILEMVKQERVPLVWNADSLEKALKIEKELNVILNRAYRRAYSEFMEGS